MLALMFFLGLSRMVFPPLVDSFTQSFDVRQGAIGLTFTLLWFATAVSTLPTSYLLARVQRRKMVLTTGLLVGAASLLAGTAPSIWIFTAGGALLGLGLGGYFIASNPLLTELYPARIGHVIGVHGTAYQLAGTIAPLVVTGVLTVTSWRITFVVIGALVLLSTGRLYLIGSESNEATDDRPVDAGFLAGVSRQWNVVAAGLAMTGGVLFVWMGVYSFYVPYLVSTKSFSPSMANLMLSIVFAAGVPAFWFSGTISDRLSRVRLLLTIAAVFPVVLSLLTVVSEVPGVAIISIVLGFTLHSLYPAVDSYVLGTVPNENRSAAYAVLLGMTFAVQAPGSLVVGALVEWGYPYDLLFRTSAVALVCVFVLLAAAGRTGLFPE